MILPWLSGSLLKAASCQSPTVSKNRPTAQTSRPSQACTVPVFSLFMPTMTGVATSHMATPWGMNTRRRADLGERASVGLGHVLVARVLGQLRVAELQVGGEPYAPYEHQEEQEQLRPGHAVAVSG